MKKITAILLAALVLMVSLVACSKSNNNNNNGNGGNASGMGGSSGTSNVTVRFQNFKPESANVYERIAADYESETGVKMIVETAASGNYESTLKARLATDQYPTLFQVNGPVGYARWKDFCADLSNTEIYKHMSDKSIAVTSKDGGVYGIPFVVEGYGIICNEAIFDKYFDSPNKTVDVDDLDEIDTFEELRGVTEDMTRMKDELGIKGVFASTSLKSGEDWRWHTHLMNLPIYYEFKKNNYDLAGDDYKNITFENSERFKNIFDLYINNSVSEKTKLGTVDVTASMAEFALGQCAMVQNGNWAWSQISKVDGNTVKEEDLHFMPIYTGMEGEEGQGLCIGSENFICINAMATEDEQKAAADFLYWLYSSKTGKKYVTDELGFIAPFDTFDKDEAPSDPLAQEVLRYMQDSTKESVTWNFTLFPSQTFKDDLGASLLQYAQGTRKWDDVKNQVVSGWSTEWQLLDEVNQ